MDSVQLAWEALAGALDDVGVRLDPDWYWPRHAIASPDMLIMWESEFGPLPEPIPAIIDRCRQRVVAGSAGLDLIEPMVAVARSAKARGQGLAIASNSARITLDAGLDAKGLRTLFDATACWSDVPAGRGKPEPDIFELAAKRLDVDPAECLVYEDAEDGIKGALAAGMDAYNVRTGELSTPPHRVL